MRPAVVLGAAMLVAAITLSLLTGDQTLKDDEWGYSFRLVSQPLTEALFEPPPNKHLVALPLLLYAGMFDQFGIDSYVPYRALGIGFVVLCSGLLFIWLRRRVGGWLALPAPILLLFLGSSSEVVASSHRLPSLVAVAAGLGMLLALDRRSLRGDLAACALLLVSVASHSTGLAFAVAAGVHVLLRPSPERWHRLWLAGIPVGLYSAWWFLVRDPAGADIGFDAVLELPPFLFSSLITAFGAVTGGYSIARLGFIRDDADTPEAGEILDRAVAEPLLFALLVVMVVAVGVALLYALRARLAHSEPLGTGLWVALAGLLTFWITTGLVPGVERQAWESRYIFPAVVLLTLVLAEFGRGVTLSRRAITVIAVIFAVSFAANTAQLVNDAEELSTESDYIRAELSALDQVRGQVDPGFRPEDERWRDEIGDHRIPNLTAGLYFRVADEYGSPAYTPAELSERPPSVRAAAELVRTRGLASGQGSAVGAPE